MKNLLRHLNPQQTRQLDELVRLLVSRFQPEKIWCFGSRIQSSARFSCFVPRQNQGSCHYDLLIITSGTEHKEQELQDFINSRHKKGKVTILCHSAEVMNAALQLRHPFFTTVFWEGLLLYSSDTIKISPMPLPGNHPGIGLQSQEHFRAYLEQAANLLQAAWEQMAKEEYTQTLFMLHQTLKQSCTGLIQLFMGYYSGKLSLGKLLRLCSNFTAEAEQLFPQDKPDEIRLLNLLLNSTRNQAKISISKEEVQQLFERVALFLESAENLCGGRVKKG